MSSVGVGGNQAAPPPRKGAYSKHVMNLHKDQLTKLQAKNTQEIDLLEDIRTFVKQKSSLEKHYAEALLKLTNSHLNHRLASIPDIQKGDEEQNQEVNVYNLWRHVLDENEKIAKAKLAAVQVVHDDVEKDAKAVSKAKQAKTKQAFERLSTVQKELQITVAELDRTKRIYFSEETGASDVRDKAKDAEEKAKGKKKDLKSLFQSKTTLKKHAGLLSAKQEELDIRSTGARNDYILNLASANAQQDRYYKHDLQDTMQHLEGDFYKKISTYLDTISRTELLTCSAIQSSFGKLRDQASSITRLYNYECYTKVFPSLGQHITYEHEAPAGDEVRIIAPSDHDGGYSLNYEARQNASKLNQSVKTIKAYHKRIKACYYHKSKGLKHEPNDTGGPDLDTKINELQIAIRNAETERAKAEARLAKLREGGVAVDEYIDAFVAAYENEERSAEQQQPAANPVSSSGGGGAGGQEWASTSEDTAAQLETNANDAQESSEEWDNAAEPAQAGGEAAREENWASFDNQQAAADWTNGDAGWGSETVDQGQQQQQQQLEEAGAATCGGRAVRALAVYSFEAQNGDELTVTEGEELTVLLDECDEEGWLMGLNASGQRGYIPQNYIEIAAVAAQEQQQEVGLNHQQSYESQTSVQRQDSYARQGSTDSNIIMMRQDSGASQGSSSFQRQDSIASQGSAYAAGLYGQPLGMDTIPEHYELPPVPAAPPPMMDSDASSSEEEETESAAAMPPAGLPPPPARPPPGPPPSLGPAPGPPAEAQKQIRPPSISISATLDSRDFCRALYDYEATGSDEITFDEGEVIKVLKRCPNGVDDGWWLGEINSKIGLFPSIVVEELSDGETPDASSMTSPPSMAPPSFSPPPPDGPAQPPPPPKVVQPPTDHQPKPESPVALPASSIISVTVASPEAAAEKSLPSPPTEAKEAEGKFVTKPVVPCVQVSVDEVPDIPADDDDAEVDDDANGPSGGGGGFLDAMEIVVTAPTPTVQSPVDEDPPSMPTLPEEQASQNGRASPTKEEQQVGQELFSEPVDEAAAPPPPPPPAANEEEPKTADLELGDSCVIERHSSADSSVSSSASTSPSMRKKKQAKSSSSGSESAAGPDDDDDARQRSDSESAAGPDVIRQQSDSEDETESDLPLPPDQLELRQLKKLESMKESTA